MVSTLLVSAQELMHALCIGVAPGGALSFHGLEFAGRGCMDGFRMEPADSRLLSQHSRPISHKFWLGRPNRLDPVGLQEGWLTAKIDVLGGRQTAYTSSLSGSSGELFEGEVTVGAFLMPSSSQTNPIAGIAGYVDSRYTHYSSYSDPSHEKKSWFGLLATETGALRAFNTKADVSRMWREAEEADLSRFAGCLMAARIYGDDAVSTILSSIAERISNEPKGLEPLTWLLHRWDNIADRSDRPWR